VTVPYRVDIRSAGLETFDTLVELGALDAEPLGRDGIAAVMPDAVSPGQLEALLGTGPLAISPAVSRDEGSVWVLTVRPVRVGGYEIVLTDAPAFGTGRHPTTALCLEAIEEIVAGARPETMLDIGTGSGVLALAALKLGVPAAHGIDIDEPALGVAGENARVNGLEQRLALTLGGPEAIQGTWPLVVANVLAAPLIEMAPSLVRRIGHQGDLVLSGIPVSLEHEVGAAYRRLGLHLLRTTSRQGWSALVFRVSW
jgi:ribosomal protein L11 methyltransferase